MQSGPCTLTRLSLWRPLPGARLVSHYLLLLLQELPTLESLCPAARRPPPAARQVVGNNNSVLWSRARAEGFIFSKEARARCLSWTTTQSEYIMTAAVPYGRLRDIFGHVRPAHLCYSVDTYNLNNYLCSTPVL